jgi:hypothetical protein
VLHQQGNGTKIPSVQAFRMEFLSLKEVSSNRHYCTANIVTKKKVDPSDIRVRPRVRLPNCIISRQLRKITLFPKIFFFSHKSGLESTDSNSTSAQAVSNESQLNPPNMGYGSTSPNQNGSDREKHADVADSSPPSPPDELVGSSDGFTTADKPSPRKIHGWKVSTPTPSTYVHTFWHCGC